MWFEYEDNKFFSALINQIVKIVKKFYFKFFLFFSIQFVCNGSENLVLDLNSFYNIWFYFFFIDFRYSKGSLFIYNLHTLIQA